MHALVQIREQYPLTGEVRQFKRRDLRKGMNHTGTPPQAGLLELAFGISCISGGQDLASSTGHRLDTFFVTNVT